ncbi:MAG: hypothetical protein EGQ00_05740 [Parabacteroides johnsonii]|nr:hypothetical protein [Parabacteroides johnsonii]
MRKFEQICQYYRGMLACLLFVLPFLFCTGVNADAVAARQDTVRRSIYPQDMKNKSNLYNKLWGVHYRALYSTPVTADAVTLQTLQGGMEIMEQAEDFHALILSNRQNRLYMLKPLGGSTSFLESKFFREIYNRNDFKGTYLDEFIGDAYTIINPYTFLAADRMAQASGLNFNDPRIYFMQGGEVGDTIADGTGIRNRLVSLRNVPDTATQKNILSTGDLLKQIRQNKSRQVNQEEYITGRLYDMLIGDWNKIPENWNWQAVYTADSILFSPIVIDRSHAFTKIDGLLFKRMLKVLGLGFITNYSNHPKDIGEINTLGYTLDMALASSADESVWTTQALALQKSLSDSVIDEAFSTLPPEIQGAETEAIKKKLLIRRDSLPYMAHHYYKKLQRTPVLTGTEGDDRIVLERFGRDSLLVRIYPREDSVPSFQKKYAAKETAEIWLYGLDGNDEYEVKGKSKREIPVYLITGPGHNTYKMEKAHKIRIYAYDADREQLDKISGVHKIISDSPAIHTYDYEKVKYKELDFTPWGFYDSDVGFSLGAFFTYTMYGFKQSPFTFRHRVGYNYLQGFMYQGTFPFYDARKSFNLDAFIASPRNFFNFFGYGNNTEGFKDEGKAYNRVTLRQYSVVPSFRMEIKKDRQLTLSASFEMYKAKHTEGRYINQVLPDSHPVFGMNLFVGVEADWRIRMVPSAFIPELEVEASSGWKMNLKDVRRNFPYSKLDVSATFRCSDRFSVETGAEVKLLYNNKYDFYQAAGITLRGFRDNRFIGKQSFYQHTDFRLDMGKIRNPFTPLKYGLFAGFDYGRVWFPDEHSRRWHTSYGGGFWLTIVNKVTTQYSCFGSEDGARFLFAIRLGI